MRPQLILLGAPGSGKGTQAKNLISNFGYTHISTGDLLRSEIEKGSDLGNKVKSIMDAGNLVDDQTVLDILKVNCKLDKSSYIFDGYPRNLEQAKALDEVVLTGAESMAIYFEVNVDKLVERIVNRRVAPKSGEIYNLETRPPKVDGICDISGEELIHRKDDNEETVRNRMKVYTDNIGPVLEYYKSQNRLKQLDASQDAEAVYSGLVKVIENQ